ncbi:MAG: hypothetical protein JWR10_4268 [Rubritepida sp.]|nr:hypothetical protein [Rubritepida sp.]
MILDAIREPYGTNFPCWPTCTFKTSDQMPRVAANEPLHTQGAPKRLAPKQTPHCPGFGLACALLGSAPRICPPAPRSRYLGYAAFYRVPGDAGGRAGGRGAVPLAGPDPPMLGGVPPAPGSVGDGVCVIGVVFDGRLRPPPTVSSEPPWVGGCAPIDCSVRDRDVSGVCAVAGSERDAAPSTAPSSIAPDTRSLAMSCSSTMGRQPDGTGLVRQTGWTPAGCGAGAVLP